MADKVDPNSEEAKGYINAEMTSEVISGLRDGAIEERCPHSPSCRYVNAKTLNNDGIVFNQTSDGELFIRERENGPEYVCPAIEIHNRHYTDINANDRCSHVSQLNMLLRIERMLKTSEAD